MLSKKPELKLSQSDVPAISGLRQKISAWQRCPVVFMFPGGGAQYSGMAQQLYESEPTFRREVDACVSLAPKYLAQDLLSALCSSDAACTAMQRPSVSLSALFVIEYSLARLWLSFGVRPEAMIGHSLGEYVAACLAGVFFLQDAIDLVALRGLLFEKVGAGAMLSVPLAQGVVSRLLRGRLSIAAVNGPALCVVSGKCRDIDAFEHELRAISVETQRVPINVAAHSALLDGVLSEFSEAVARVPLQAPVMNFVSNVTGTWISAAEATSPLYWTQHFCRTVQFATGVNTLFKMGYKVFVEVGPGRVLSSLARLQDCGGDRTFVPSMRRKYESAADTDVFRSSLSLLAGLHGMKTVQA